MAGNSKDTGDGLEETRKYKWWNVRWAGERAVPTGKARDVCRFKDEKNSPEGSNARLKKGFMAVTCVLLCNITETTFLQIVYHTVLTRYKNNLWINPSKAPLTSLLCRTPISVLAVLTLFCVSCTDSGVKQRWLFFSQSVERGWWENLLYNVICGSFNTVSTTSGSLTKAGYC